jgi:cold shock CspA family protein
MFRFINWQGDGKIMQHGVIKWFNELKGCGYVENQDGTSLFFYDPKLLNNSDLQEGKAVHFDTKDHESGLFSIAVNLKCS